MARKKAKIPQGITFAGLLAIAIALQLMPQRITNNFNFLFNNLFGSVLNVGANKMVQSLSPKFSSEDYIPRDEAEQLKAALDNLWAKLVTLQEKYDKLAQIKEGLPEAGPQIMLKLSNIRNVSISGPRHELLIDKGASDGVRPGQFVIERNSLIGTVSEVSDFTAKVRLVTDASHKIEIRIWRLGRKGYIPGQLLGTGKKFARIPLISREYDVRQGDSVYAAPKPGYLGIPYVIGTIEEVKRDENKPLLYEITVRPIFDAEKLETAAVILTDDELIPDI